LPFINMKCLHSEEKNIGFQQVPLKNNSNGCLSCNFVFLDLKYYKYNINNLLSPTVLKHK